MLAAPLNAIVRRPLAASVISPAVLLSVVGKKLYLHQRNDGQCPGRGSGGGGGRVSVIYICSRLTLYYPLPITFAIIIIGS